MARVWKEIRHADKEHEAGSILSLQAPVTLLSSNCDENKISALDNSKKAQHWRTVKTPQEIALYLKLCNRLHFVQAKGTPFTVPPLEEFYWAANLHHSEMVLE
eukprot:12406496-Ditylum_brightwellii.AAC.1